LSVFISPVFAFIISKSPFHHPRSSHESSVLFRQIWCSTAVGTTAWAPWGWGSRSWPDFPRPSKGIPCHRGTRGCTHPQRQQRRHTGMHTGMRTHTDGDTRGCTRTDARGDAHRDALTHGGTRGHAHGWMHTEMHTGMHTHTHTHTRTRPRGQAGSGIRTRTEAAAEAHNHGGTNGILHTHVDSSALTPTPEHTYKQAPNNAHSHAQWYTGSQHQSVSRTVGLHGNNVSHTSDTRSD